MISWQTLSKNSRKILINTFCIAEASLYNHQQPIHYHCFLTSRIFGAKIQLFHTLQDDFFKHFLQFWRKNSIFWTTFSRDVTSRGSNSTRSSNLYYCLIKARSSKFIFEPKLELARTRNNKSSRVQPKYRCQSRTN